MQQNCEMQFSTLDCMSNIDGRLYVCAISIERVRERESRDASASFMRNWTSTSCVIFTFHSHPCTILSNSLNNFSYSRAMFSLSFFPLSAPLSCCCILHYCLDITACGIAFESYQTGAKSVVKRRKKRERERERNKRTRNMDKEIVSFSLWHT